VPAPYVPQGIRFALLRQPESEYLPGIYSAAKAASIPAKMQEKILLSNFHTAAKKEKLSLKNESFQIKIPQGRLSEKAYAGLV